MEHLIGAGYFLAFDGSIGGKKRIEDRLREAAAEMI